MLPKKIMTFNKCSVITRVVILYCFLLFTSVRVIRVMFLPVITGLLLLSWLSFVAKRIYVASPQVPMDMQCFASRLFSPQ